MADYNIYIHSTDIQQNGGQSFTLPWKQSEEDQETGSSSMTGGEMASANVAELASYAKTISKGGKAGVFGVVAAIAIKVVTTVAKTRYEINMMETGDYHSQIQLQYWKDGVNAVFTPLSTHMNMIKQRTTLRIESERNALQRELLGDSEINRYTNRGC